MNSPPLRETEIGRCICGVRIDTDSFRDRDSYRDVYITGLCQACQDRTYFGVDEEYGTTIPIFDGALVAARAPGTVSELSLLPLRFVVPGPRRARCVWDAYKILRVGPWIDRLDLSLELDPMASLLAGHQIRAREHQAFDADEVSEHLTCLHLLVGMDRPALDTASRVCRVPDSVSQASLSDEVPWAAEFGRALRPVDSWWGPERGPLSTLRTCALMGLLLMERGRERLRPLDYLLSGRSRFFPQRSNEQS